jgi:hypothetical protein
MISAIHLYSKYKKINRTLSPTWSEIKNKANTHFSSSTSSTSSTHLSWFVIVKYCLIIKIAFDVSSTLKAVFLYFWLSFYPYFCSIFRYCFFSAISSTHSTISPLPHTQPNPPFWANCPYLSVYYSLVDEDSTYINHTCK